MADTASVEDGTAGAVSPRVEAPPATTGEGKGRWLVLLAMVVGLFMPMMANLVVNVAVPTIQGDLAAQVSDMQWVIDAYILTFASFLLIGGSLGDIAGRKKVFLSGLVLFTLGSLAGGLSGSAEQLIAFRALQGLGAALVLPGSLSILTATFPGRHRGTAIGIWAAISGLAVAAGPLVGGYIVEHHSWQTIFFINIPVGIAALLLTAVVVKESRDPSGDRRVDFPGLVTGTAGLLLFVYALMRGGVEGWTDDLTLGSFAGSALLLILFVVIERKKSSPMLPLHLFRNSTFAAANVVAASAFFALFGTTSFLSLYLQTVRGFSPLETGIRLIPFAAAILLISPVAGKISDKYGSRWLMSVGCLYAAGGMALLMRIDPASSYTDIILPALVVLGAGMALTMAPMTTAVMGSVDPRHFGVASAATNTARGLGGVLGIALLGALVTSTFRDRLLEDLTGAGIAAPAAQSIVEGASGNAAAAGGALEAIRQQIPAGTPEGVVAQVMTAAQSSFVDAMSAGVLVGVGFLLLAALVALIFVRSHAGQEHPEEVSEPLVHEEEKVERYEEIGTAADIDPGTEQLLRESLEPPAAVGLPDPIPPEPVHAGEPDAGAPEEEPSTPGEEVGLERRKAPSLPPVSQAVTHYHPKPVQPEGDGGWEPEEDALGAPEARDSYYRLRELMVNLPLKAGAGQVEKNLEEVAQATLSYYQYGLSQPGGDALPVGVTDGAQSSPRQDIATLAGYLDLEKRFDRVSESLSSEQAAAQLMAALASRALKGGSRATSGHRKFVRDAVRACLGEADPLSSPEPSGNQRAGDPQDRSTDDPPRVVYRRRGVKAGPDE